MKTDRILVTGAAGFVGACLTRKLVGLFGEVNVIARQSSNLWRIKDVTDKIILHRVDLTDAASLSGIIQKMRPEIIFHLATYGGYYSQRDANKIFETNLIGTKNLLTALSGVGFKAMINTGSSSEYGLKTQPMSEGDLLEPVTEYGVSKATATLYCQMVARRNNLPVCTLRLFSPYGFFEGAQRLVPSVILACLAGRDPELSFKEPVRDFIFIEDVADAYLKAAFAPAAGGQILNIGSGKEHSVGEVVEKIITLTGKKVSPRWGSVKNLRPEPVTWVADIGKADKLIQWKPAHSLDEGLEKTVAWFRQNRHLYDEKL